MFTSQPYLNDLDGRTRAITIPLGVGVDFTIETPAGYLWDFLSLDARLVTSGVVNNRTPTFIFDDGANRIWQDQGPVQAAGATVDYLVGEGLSRDVTLAALIKLTAPTDLRLFSGWRARSSTTLLDVGDQWIVTMTVREYQTNVVTGPRAGSRYTGGSLPTKLAAPRRPGRAY